MGVPILTYHAMRVDGNRYEENDLAALRKDIEVITEAGFAIAPLHRLIAQWLASGKLPAGNVVAITCDDGSDFDFVDLPHPVAGPQRSVINILRDFQASHPGAQPGLHVTSFVVVSPAARERLDVTCMIGKGWWSDHWWLEAAASGLLGIASHSWDHNHDTLEGALFDGHLSGTFLSIASEAAADYEIRQANDYLREHCPNPSTTLFAYPYGDAAPFLVESYFPAHSEDLGIDAAFTDDAGMLEADTPRWAIPRFMFGRDWKSPGELQSILAGSLGR
jgi:peptidoglycan/xylan/chitin deacetylase (PgdA/CDA1 family)